MAKKKTDAQLLPRKDGWKPLKGGGRWVRVGCAVIACWRERNGYLAVKAMHWQREDEPDHETVEAGANPEVYGDTTRLVTGLARGACLMRQACEWHKART